jgi:thiol:disulfide interchange protein DsbD
VLLSVYFCLCVEQANAWNDDTCRMVPTFYRFSSKAFSSKELDANFAFRSQAPSFSSDKESILLLAITIVPPDNAYLYGPGSTEGLPTRMEVVFAPMPVYFADTLIGDKANLITRTLQREGKTLDLRIPQALFKKNTIFAANVLPGGGSSNPRIYPGPVTFWAEVPAFGGVIMQIRLSGLLCTASSCTPVSKTGVLLLSATDIAALPTAERQSWWPSWVRGESVFVEPHEEKEKDSRKYRQDTFFISLNDEEKPFLSGRLETFDTVMEAQNNAKLAPERQRTVFSNFEPEPFDPDLEVQYLGEALLLGLAAGLLLNLMPCVLPVVSLKFSALMAISAMKDKGQQAKAFKLHCLMFALGIVVCFLLLALLLGLAGWAWGELFQEPIVILVLALILFLLGLSLFGVFSLPILDLKVSSNSHPYWQSIVSGFLSTLLATPCSGPLLGGVLAWAIRQPLAVLTLTVLSVGIGMAAPYAILAFSPRLVHFLPRPGSWTIRLEQLLGFFLMGSVVYLATLLPEEWIPSFLFILFAVALASWLWGQIGHLRASRLRRGISRTVAVLIVITAAWWGKLSIHPDSTWEAFDSEQFIVSLGKEAMLLEFTADWCPSCKAMEYTTLTRSRMADLRKQYNVRTIRVDITRDAGAGKELLKALNSTSLPVLALFPKGENAKKPLILRDLVTPNQLREAALRTYGGF